MCGIFGVFGHDRAAELTFFGLHSLQHRGQESAGICVSDGTQIMTHRGTGLVSEVFAKEEYLNFEGRKAIGHVRYTTAGDSGLVNAQPLVFRYTGGQVSIAHNGNLVNAVQLRKELEHKGSIFQTSSDTEVVPHLIARSGPPIDSAVEKALSRIEGAYALLFMTEKQMIAAQDPHGFRPLSLGQFENAWIVSSETCALETIGADFVREIKPGELFVFDDDGMHIRSFVKADPRRICSFEYIYFARPDSEVDGISVHSVRKELGRQLCRESHVESDIVVGVPDSGLAAAIGYAEESGLPYELGMMKNRYVGRTFIQPNQALRQRGVRMKLSVVRRAVEGKRVVLVDDSIVRGITSGRIVSMLKKNGATEVHMRITSPPITHPCLYGIDTARRMELIAASKTEDEIREAIGADSLKFISVDGMISSTGRKDVFPDSGQCISCFNGEYPTAVN